MLAHMLDVAATAEAILDQEPAGSVAWVASVFGLPREHCQRWIAVLAGLHDFGKGIPGFQEKWPDGVARDKSQGLTFPSFSCGVTDHACATAALLGKLLLELTDTEARWVRHVLQAISAHHGFHFKVAEINNARPIREPAEWGKARHAILQAYWQILAPEGRPRQDELSLPAVNWLAGITSAADWIASNPEWFPLGERHDDLHAYYAHAKVLAADALGRIGWSQVQKLQDEPAALDTLLSRITQRKDMRARPLQQAGERLLNGAKGPSLMLVEAPMGEGKTELAFLCYLRLQAANEHRGLYVALPTQATGNAMFKRAQTFLAAFATNPLDVQLVHGGASMNEDAQHLRTVHLRGINQDKGEALAASAWFSQRRRPLLSPYGVGTIDQALFSVLNVKHHFVRLWGLGNRVVVLDEVHAYDTYTSGLIVTLLQWLKALGSSVVLMSATLPRARRDELLAAWGVELGAVPELAYPRLLLVDDHGVHGDHFSARPLPPIQLARLGEDVEELADQAGNLLAAGGCGAVIVNTVDRAQTLYRLLRERLEPDIPLLLFHARYPMDERSKREQDVLSKFGPAPNSDRPGRGLLIATQVAEQSLDLDFDFMLSDLAPIDLLLQRAGRLHRHADRQRPQLHREARLWVAGLEPTFPDLKATAWGFVYDPYILGRTWALLQNEETLTLPDDIDRLVQAVYGGEPLPENLSEKVQNAIEIEAYGEYRAKVNKERQQSLNIAIDPSAEPQSAYIDKPRGNDEDDLLGLRNSTRLGRETITLVPIEVDEGGWRVLEEVVSPDQQLDDACARFLYGRQLRLSRMAVVKHFQGMDLPVAFAEHPLLRNFRPLPLTQGGYDLLGIRLRLDAELGLVYEIEDSNVSGG
ncbi:CRISPR-associated endonuclease/helicase Cas3 [Kerstersia gyiorum]|uniref:CRISPR-associated helicase Cas3' n=1 Tax=Kerstersia gyiorum TaxID=206506 RepID=UPI0020A0046B|nr:CRISPR-associated endonuclease/helicase Cas3 [Kerstersia gyiorum]MCP1637488.1 CRISPR-associated endonuclease/helicase Cas3 [Kerstersia gyiorum]MCP1671636.1 CRISPR-associated endonuclease/helicase Cas3 [Kerstersia gyiorum]MCP1679470.1 CRISPR-associated endonuclease/helicase Cas3 [Kerstersia gyiorum]MCP1683085.1 CRISPR-associated endonuclease/helicase Cas3 [Kerstersia gyiorum]